jgi:hypothetical protein
LEVNKRLKEVDYRQQMASQEVNPENKDTIINQFRLKQFLEKLMIEE